MIALFVNSIFPLPSSAGKRSGDFCSVAEQAVDVSLLSLLGSLRYCIISLSESLF